MNQKVRDLRRRLELTQEKMAKTAGISRHTLHKLESGKSKVYRTDTIQRVANVLGVPISDIFFELDVSSNEQKEG